MLLTLFAICCIPWMCPLPIVAAPVVTLFSSNLLHVLGPVLVPVIVSVCVCLCVCVCERNMLQGHTQLTG